MDIFEVIDKFQFHALSADWIESQWRSDFSSQDRELPTDYALVLDDEDYSVLLRNLSESIHTWVSESNESTMNATADGVAGSRHTWQVLINSGVDHRALIAFVSSFMKFDVKDLTDDVSRSLALEASRTYFNLLRIPGLTVFRIYNNFLFYQAIEGLKVLTLAQDVGEVGRQPGKSKIRRNRSGQDENQSDDVVDVGDCEGVTFSAGEKIAIVQYLIVILEDLHKCLRCVSFEGDDDSLRCTINALVALVRLEKTTANFLDHRPSKSNSVTYLSYKAYQVLIGLCTEHHGSVEAIVIFICQSLMPHLIYTSQDHLTNNKTKGIICGHMLAFLKTVIDKVGQSAHNGLYALTQQLCLRAPDRAEIRGKCVQQVLTLMSYFPYELSCRCLLWLCSLSVADIVKHRIFALEVLLRVLNGGDGEMLIPAAGAMTEISEEDDIDDEDGNLLGNSDRRKTTVSSKLILGALVSRFFDQSPTVRAKSLASFAPLVLVQSSPMKDLIHGIFKTPYDNLNGPITDVIQTENEFFNYRQFFHKRTTPPENPLPGGTRLIYILEILSGDTKVFVRKAAINALSNVCRLDPKWITNERIQIFIKSCLDHSVMVRKMMVQCLTELVLQYPENDMLIEAWVLGVFPLVADNEVKSQEKTIENVSLVVLDNLVSSENMTSSLHDVPWKVVKLIRQFQMKNLMKYICRHWANSKRIGPQCMKILLSHVGTENDLEAWHFIVFISEFIGFIKPDTFVEYYESNIHAQDEVGEMKSQLVLEAIYYNWREIKKPVIDNLVKEKLLPALESCDLPVTSMPATVDICHHYDKEAFIASAKILIEKCEQFLVNNISPDSPPKVSQQALAQHLFALGEVISICTDVVSESTIMLISQLVDDLGLLNAGAKWNGHVSSITKAIAVITLGKFCLQNHSIAKKLVPALGALLAPDTPSPVKINTLTSMTDLFARYATTVDCYLGDMCVCLKDADVSVRNTTLTLMMKLIQEDYVKLKCPYFYYILQMLQDSEEQIQRIVKAFIINTVLTKNPRIMLTEFLQALYFLNEYDGNDGMSLAATKVVMNPNEKKAFNLSGPENIVKRRQLLRTMVELMMDDYKCRSTLNICSTIFDAVSEGRMLVDRQSEPMIADAIYILGTEEMRLSSKSRSDDGEDEEQAGQDAQNAQFQDMLNVLLKRMFKDTIIPSIIKFKRKLQELKSPLVPQLMLSLRAMMKEFKDSWNELLSDDASLAAEIEFDMRVAEERELEAANQPNFPEEPQADLSFNAEQGCPGKSPRRSTSAGRVNPSEIASTPPATPLDPSEDEVSSLSNPSICSQKGESPVPSSPSTSQSPAASPVTRGNKRKMPRPTPSPTSNDSLDSEASLPLSPIRKRPNKESGSKAVVKKRTGKKRTYTPTSPSHPSTSTPKRKKPKK